MGDDRALLRRLPGACLVVALSLFSLFPIIAQEAPPAVPDAPLDVGLQESVDIRFVLVDFLVLDREGRTVSGIEREDLKLKVEGKLTPIATLDRNCPEGEVAELGSPSDVPAEGDGEAEPKRIVLVFDYAHMTDVAATLDQAYQALETWGAPSDLHMIASMGQVVRIESPFTADLDALRWTLQRMRNDPDLYGGNYGSLTETRFFERIEVLFDLMEQLPGRKSIVLFSGPLAPDGYSHDPSFNTLAAMAGTSRTAIYPVDTAGLRTPDSPAGGLGGPAQLSRLALETGGRMTASTNAIGLAYARAHRDLGCAYTLGFEDTRVRLDRSRDVKISVRGRKDLRVVSPGSYVIRSHEQRRKSMQHTAAMTPHMFDSPSVAVDLFTLGPASGDRWRTAVGVEVSGAALDSAGGSGKRELEVMLRRQNGTVIHSFRRELELPPLEPGRRPSVTLFEEADLPPGRYVVSAVLSDPAEQMPLASTRPAVLPEILRDEPFLVGPILGRRRGDADRFVPLLSPVESSGQALDALTLVCTVGGDADGGSLVVTREVIPLGGGPSIPLEPATVRLTKRDRAWCHELVDDVSRGTLTPGRYELSVRIEGAAVLGGNAAEFTIGPAEAP